ncbi:MAG: MFS transporter [Mediterranea sp.]|jgi:fucose permease|nr:MFS transporter [Mediterranea sp.]
MTRNYHPTLVFIAACIGMCFFGISVITLGAILPSLTDKLHLDTLQATSLVTFLPLGTLAGSLLFGPVVDGYGYKTLLLLSSLGVLIGLEGITYFETLPALQFAVFLIGLGGGILNGETNALVADLYDSAEKSSRISLLGTFYGIGALGIPALLGFLSEFYSLDTILRAIGVLVFGGILFCLFVRFPAPKQAQGFPIKQGLGLLKERFLLLFSFLLFFQSGIEGISNNWTTLYLEQTTAIPSAKILVILSCMMIGVTASRIVLVFLLKKISQRIILQVSLLIAAAGFVCLTFSPDFVRAAVGMLLVGIGISATYPVTLGSISSRYPALSGTAFSVALTISLVGQTVINALMGGLTQLYGTQVYPLLTLLSLLVMLLLFRTVSSQK